jgi:hypothetical protein
MSLRCSQQQNGEYMRYLFCLKGTNSAENAQQATVSHYEQETITSRESLQNQKQRTSKWATRGQERIPVDVKVKPKALMLQQEFALSG